VSADLTYPGGDSVMGSFQVYANGVAEGDSTYAWDWTKNMGSFTFGEGVRAQIPVGAAVHTDYGTIFKDIIVSGTAVTADGKYVFAGTKYGINYQTLRDGWPRLREFPGYHAHATGLAGLRYPYGGILTGFAIPVEGGQRSLAFANMDDEFGSSLYDTPPATIEVANSSAMTINGVSIDRRYTESYRMALAGTLDGKSFLAAKVEIDAVYTPGATGSFIGVPQVEPTFGASIAAPFSGLGPTGQLVQPGVIKIPFAGCAAARQVAIDRAGRIVLVGYVTLNGRTQTAIVRLCPDGSIDRLFGTGGFVTIHHADWTSSYASAVAIPEALIRTATTDVPPPSHTPEGGTGDTPFEHELPPMTVPATCGPASINQTSQQVSFQEEAIIVAGTARTPQGNRFFAVRLRPNGQPETHFGTSGVVQFDFSADGAPDDAEATLLASRFNSSCQVTATGCDRLKQIVILGRARTSSGDARVATAALTSLGALDVGFEADGKIVTNTIAADSRSPGFDVPIAASYEAEYVVVSH
jgi:uncharacterized delta-60 repeat protein